MLIDNSIKNMAEVHCGLFLIAQQTTKAPIKLRLHSRSQSPKVTGLENEEEPKAKKAKKDQEVGIYKTNY